MFGEFYSAHAPPRAHIYGCSCVLNRLNGVYEYNAMHIVRTHGGRTRVDRSHDLLIRFIIIIVIIIVIIVFVVVIRIVRAHVRRGADGAVKHAAENITDVRRRLGRESRPNRSLSSSATCAYRGHTTIVVGRPGAPTRRLQVYVTYGRAAAEWKPTVRRIIITINKRSPVVFRHCCRSLKHITYNVYGAITISCDSRGCRLHYECADVCLLSFEFLMAACEKLHVPALRIGHSPDELTRITLSGRATLVASIE